MEAPFRDKSERKSNRSKTGRILLFFFPPEVTLVLLFKFSLLKWSRCFYSVKSLVQKCTTQVRHRLRGCCFAKSLQRQKLCVAFFFYIPPPVTSCSAWWSVKIYCENWVLSGGEDMLRSKQINILRWNSKKTPSSYLHSNRRPQVLRCPDPPACLQGASSSSGPWRRRAAGRQVRSAVSFVSLWIFCSGTRPASNHSNGGERSGGGQTCKLITSHSFSLRFQPDRVMSRSPSPHLHPYH